MITLQLTEEELRVLRVVWDNMVKHPKEAERLLADKGDIGFINSVAGRVKSLYTMEKNTHEL